MTTFSPTLLLNAITYVGQTPTPKADPPPKGLRGTYNRTFFCDWPALEPEEGRFDWTLLDAYVRTNLAQGRRPIVLLKSVPGWTNGHPLLAFPTFCYALRDHLLTLKIKPDDVLIELGNEADVKGDGNYGSEPGEDLPGFWSVGHQVFSGAGFRVILGSVMSLGREGIGLQYLAEWLRDFGAARHAVSVHLYDIPGVSDPSMWTEQLHQVRGVMIAHGAADAELWVTEYGVFRGKTGELGKMHADWPEREQVQRQRNAMRAIQRGGADAALFFALDAWDRNHGALGYDNVRIGTARWNKAERTR